MDFRPGTGVARGWLAAALILVATAALAGNAPLPAAREPAPGDTAMGSAIHAQVLRQLAALSPAARIAALRSRAEAGESIVLLLFLAQEEARQGSSLARAVASPTEADAGDGRAGTWFSGRRSGAARAAVAADEAPAGTGEGTHGGDERSELDHRADAVMAEAARHGLAAYVAMRTVAPLCSDRTSPDQYLSELGDVLLPVLGWLSRQDSSVKDGVVRAALALEERLVAPGRTDPMLCRRGQFGDRFCPPGPQDAACPDNPARFAEFTISEPLVQHQQRMRRVAREEVRALAR